LPPMGDPFPCALAFTTCSIPHVPALALRSHLLAGVHTGVVSPKISPHSRLTSCPCLHPHHLPLDRPHPPGSEVVTRPARLHLPRLLSNLCRNAATTDPLHSSLPVFARRLLL
jgi:hypothetical protein